MADREKREEDGRTKTWISCGGKKALSLNLRLRLINSMSSKLWYCLTQRIA